MGYDRYQNKGQRPCGKSFIQAFESGQVKMDVMDRNTIYSLENSYYRDDEGRSNNVILFNLDVIEDNDFPYTASGGKNMSKDHVYLILRYLSLMNRPPSDHEL